MIVDANLGQGSGIMAMAQILRIGPMPHVFISGGGLSDMPPGAIILRKPFMQKELELAMARALKPPVCAVYRAG
jgi:hypothetical protein